jgi:glycosyltransferase involved in cell wall biosynthesis
VSKGGAEISAFQLYEELKARPNIQASFVSASNGRIQERLGARFVQPFGPDDYVYSGAGFDHFIHSNPDPEFPPEVTKLLEELRPDVVHLHHYTNFGVEFLLHIRRAAPKARIVVTLHEYLAICNHFGQMVKRPTFALCERASPRDCARCFPEKTEQDFFLRELFVKRFFRLVNHFISPSQFLADRYVAWGIERERMSVIENGMPHHPGHVPYPPTGDGVVIGFFGQISRLKGINVLFEAAEILQKWEVEGLRIDVYGDYSNQPPEFRKDFEERLAKAPDNVRYVGPYENRRVHALMQSVHAVAVPSIWWENSPLVIQEALLNRRPLICSDIGGMAEKVRDGLDGFHFQTANAWSLATLLRRLAEDPAQLAALQSTLAVPPSLRETADLNLAVYGSGTPTTGDALTSRADSATIQEVT